MRSLSLPMTLLATALTLGCGKKESLVPIDQFPKALIGLEAKTEEVFAAFERGDPKAADGPIHNILRDFNVVKRLAEPAGLNADQQLALTKATEQLLDAYHDLHAPMHKQVFPEDFDFEPIRERLFEGLKAVRAALPTSFLAQMQAAKDARDKAHEKARAEERPASTPPVEQEATPAAEPDAGSTPADDLLEEATPDPDPGVGATTAANAFRLADGRSAGTPAPLCPTVMMWDDRSYELAAERVARAAQLMEVSPPDRRWVQLVPTLHARLNPDLTINSYGAAHERNGSWTSPDNFGPATDALADRFREAFAAAIGQAVRRGMHVSILPHLDPAGGPTVEWRNQFDFAPGEVIGVGSYESLLIDPLADAVEAEATSDTRFDFALSGEMGRSLFEHPADYLGLVKRLRGRFAANHRTRGVRIGLALNWSGLAGSEPLDPLNRPAAVELFQACDFVSFSCYAPVSVPPKVSDFEMATKNFLAEVRTLVGDAAQGKRLFYTEAGIGGGGKSVEAIAAKPYEGRGVPKVDPWKSDERRALRLAYHEALCEYLGAGVVEKAFLWSEGPWDPQGVTDQRFRNETIAGLIDKHNQDTADSPAGG